MQRAASAAAGSQVELWLIVGSDSLRRMRHSVKRVICVVNRLVAPEDAALLAQVPLQQVVDAYADAPAISSTEVRERIAAGLDVSGMVAPAVAQYHSEHRIQYREVVRGDEGGSASETAPGPGQGQGQGPDRLQLTAHVRATGLACVAWPAGAAPSELAVVGRGMSADVVRVAPDTVAKVYRCSARRCWVEAAFRAETAVYGRLAALGPHPALLQCRGAGVCDAGPFILTEALCGGIWPFVSGRPHPQIANADRRPPPPGPRALAPGEAPFPDRAMGAALAALAEGLARLHAAGLLHGDVTVANVLLAGAACAPRLVLADFGAWQIQDYAIASPAYKPPELLLRGRAYDANGEVYSLGLLLVELARGVPLWPVGVRARDPAVQRGLATGCYGAVALRAPVEAGVWAGVRWRGGCAGVVRACVAEDPADRPTAAQLAAALRDAVRGGGGEAPADAALIPDGVACAGERGVARSSGEGAGDGLRCGLCPAPAP